MAVQLCVRPGRKSQAAHLKFSSVTDCFVHVLQDADYFLQVTESEENRLQSLCSLCEIELLNESLSEEGKL